MDRNCQATWLQRTLAVTAGLTIALLSTASHADDAETTDSWTLRWANGDELAGRLVSVADKKLTWHSPVLARPVSLDLEVLQSMTGPELPEGEKPADDWRFNLTTGDVMHGNLVRIEPDSVVLESARHGRVTIGREWVRQFARTTYQHPVDLIKAAGSGWQSLDPAWRERGSGLADWMTDQPRIIKTTAPGARLFFPTDLPDLCQIEFHLECSARLGFSLALGGIEHLKQRTGDLEIETWGDELVVQSASSTGEFEHLLRLSLDTKAVSYRVFWDRTDGRVFIYDQAGQLIVDADIDPADEEAAKGVLLENKGKDLTIRMLRISHWNGQQAPGVIVDQDRVRTMAGVDHSGAITGPDAEGMMAIASGSPGGETRQVPLDSIVEVAFPNPENEVDSARPCALEVHDGTALKGRLKTVDQGIARIDVPFLDSDLAVDLQGLRECRFSTNPQDVNDGSSHVLHNKGLELHGHLAPAETAFGWRLTGSDDVIELSTDSSVRITRLDESSQPLSESPADTDIVYFTGGDQVPCRIEQIDEQFVTLTTSLAPATKVPRSDVQAMEFDVRRVAQLSSFTAPGWKVQGGTLSERTRDRMVFEETAQISHPDLLRGGTCEFDIQWDQSSQTLLYLSLSADGNALGNNRQMFYLIFNGDSIQVHTRSGRGAQRANVSNRPRREASLTVRLEATGGRINLVIDDEILGSLERVDPQSPMVGVTIGCQPMNARRNQPRRRSHLVISNIRSGRGDGLFRGVALTEPGREHILTIPRSRRDHPPGAVLVAQNGDLLRGELVAFNRTAVAFRSRLEDVSIPTNRLAGIVFPPQPEEEDEEAEEPAPRSQNEDLVQVTLHNGVVLNLTPQRVAGEDIVGTHPVLGLCRVKVSTIDQLQTGELMSESPRRMFTEWTLVRAPEPVIPDGSGPGGFGTYSELVGQPAADFSLALLDGGQFRLSEHQGKIIVLDFWASWCGPCIQALPQLTSATAAYSPDEVLFVAVNQRESGKVIREFLDTRGWDFPVALDEDGVVGGLYQVEGIPQTVIIGRSGQIEHVHLGASPNLEAELTETLRQLLEQTGNTDSQSTDASSEE